MLDNLRKVCSNNEVRIKKILVFLITFLGFTSLVGFSWSWFSAVVSGNDTAKTVTVTTADLSITYTGTANISMNNVLPGVQQTKTFTVTNTGDAPSTYDINFTDLVNTFYNTKDLTMTLTSTNSGGTLSETNVPLGGIHSPVIRNITIASGVTQTYTLTIKYKNTNEDQNLDQGKSLNGKIEVVASNEYYKDPILNGADPILDKGMVPVYYDGTTLKTANTSTEWYNYTDKEWANAVLVKANGTKTRGYYQANPNTTVAEADVLAYFVWIPRYKYTLFNATGADGTSPSSIPITFENKNTAKSTGTTNGSALTHPAFTFSGESNGFWFGKFETTGTVASPTIKPNTSAASLTNVSEQFETAQKFRTDITYGLTSETRTIKDDEWGAVAYLSHSIYGKNSEVYINPSSNLVTGRGASTVNQEQTSDLSGTASSNLYAYDGSACTSKTGYVCTGTKSTTYGLASSTTGNITGVYDMSGGAWEYSMGVLQDLNGKPYSGTCFYTNGNSCNSGYNGILGNPSYYASCNPDITSLTTGKEFPGAKYYNLFTTTNYNTACSGGPCYGKALGETRGWYSDSQSFISTSLPWLGRGGGYGWNTSTAAGIFAYYPFAGNGSAKGFRVAISE